MISEPTLRPPAAAPQSMRYDRVQVLRFFAALGVVLYHTSTYLQTKHPDTGVFVRFFDHHFSWGVELFFVISGFVIAHSIERMSVAEFARRRLLRIYPAYWLAVALVLSGRWLLGRVMPPVGDLPRPLGDLPRALGDLPQPFSDLPRALNDLPRALTLLPFGSINYPLTVEWTLVYEIFFYFLVGAAALAGWNRVRDVFCVLWVAAILIYFLAPLPPATAFLPTAGQMLFSAFNLPFITGMIVHRVHHRVPYAARSYVLLLAPALVLGSTFVARTETALLMLGLGFGALVLWAVLSDRNRRLHEGNPLIKLGDWSYGLYLAHAPAIWLLLAFSAGFSVSNTVLFLAVAVFAVLVGSMFGAVESTLYRWLLRVTRRASAPAAAPKVTAA